MTNWGKRVRCGWAAAVMAGVLVFAPGHGRFSGPSQTPRGTSDLAAQMLAPTIDEAASADAIFLSLKRNQPAKKLPRPVSLLFVLGVPVGLGLGLACARRLRFGGALPVANVRSDRAAPRAPPLPSIS